MNLTKLQIIGYFLMFIYVKGNAINGTLIDNILGGDFVTLFMSFGLLLSSLVIISRYWRYKQANKNAG